MPSNYCGICLLSLNEVVRDENGAPTTDLLAHLEKPNPSSPPQPIQASTTTTTIIPRIGAVLDCGHCFHTTPCFHQWEALQPTDCILCPNCEADRKGFVPLPVNLRTNDFQPMNHPTIHSSYGHMIRTHVQVLQRSTDLDQIQNSLRQLVDMAFTQPRCRIPIILVNGIAAVLRCMRLATATNVTRQTIHQDACQLLGNLIQEDSKTERLERSIVLQGGLQAILHTMKEFPNDAALQEQCCYSIGKISCQDAFVEMDAVKEQLVAIQRAMELHPQAILLQTYACYALSNCATLSVSSSSNHNSTVVAHPGRNKEVVDQIFAINLPAVLNAMDTHRKDEDLIDASCNVLLSIVQQPNLADYKLGSRLLHPVVQAMETHISQEVQLLCVAILLQYVTVLGANDLERIPGVAECLLQTMNEFSELIDVQRGVVQILTAASKSWLARYNEPISRALEFSLNLYSDEADYTREMKGLLEKLL